LAVQLAAEQASQQIARAEARHARGCAAQIIADAYV
jgi:hypothetical protein